MKSFTNANAKDLAHAVALVKQARDANRSVAVAGGGHGAYFTTTGASPP